MPRPRLRTYLATAAGILAVGVAVGSWTVPALAARVMDVFVTNSAADPVPVAGVVKAEQAGTWNVGITGTPNVNVVGTVTARRSAATVWTLTKTFALNDDVNSGDLAVGGFTELAVDLNIQDQRLVGPSCCGPCPTSTKSLVVSRKGADGRLYQIDRVDGLTQFTNTSHSLGVGASVNVSFGATIQVDVLQHSPAGLFCGAPWSISVIGK